MRARVSATGPAGGRVCRLDQAARSMAGGWRVSFGQRRRGRAPRSAAVARRDQRAGDEDGVHACPFALGNSKSAPGRWECGSRCRQTHRSGSTFRMRATSATVVRAMAIGEARPLSRCFSTARWMTGAQLAQRPQDRRERIRPRAQPLATGGIAAYSCWRPEFRWRRSRFQGRVHQRAPLFSAGSHASASIFFRSVSGKLQYQRYRPMTTSFHRRTAQSCGFDHERKPRPARRAGVMNRTSRWRMNPRVSKSSMRR